MICEACTGYVKRVVLHGNELWCQPCHDAANVRTKSHSVIGDEIVGGFTQTNFGHEPETFYSKHAMLRRADQLGLQPFVRHVEGDHHVPSWSCMDPYTLEAAKTLVSRPGSRVDPEPEAECATFRFTMEVK